MDLTPIQVKIAKFAAALAVFCVAMLICYFCGFFEGKQHVQAKWDKDKLVTAKAMDVLRGRIQQQEFAHRQESTAIADQLRKTEVEYEKTVSALAAEHAGRLRQSAYRADAYARLAQAGPAERGDLASHAAQLDRSLEEGRGLVGELKATLGQREDQLRLLGAQITNDRKLIGGQ